MELLCAVAGVGALVAIGIWVHNVGIKRVEAKIDRILNRGQ